MINTKNISFIILVTIFGSCNANADTTTVKSWIDKNGVMHFSNKKNVPYNAINMEIEHGKGKKYYKKNYKNKSHATTKTTTNNTNTMTINNNYKTKAGTKVSVLCKSWTQEINNIDAKLRKGHSASYGVRMEEKRWKIKQKKSKWCFKPNLQDKYVDLR